jgi:cytochrome c-type biogenesis protein CcmH/NrfF
MRPGKWFFRKHESEPTTEVAIRRGIAEDLYIVMAGFDAQSQSATLHIVINPLVNWIWIGFGVLAFGTIIALLPERVFAFATAKVPAGAATTTMLLLCLFASPALAQHDEGASNAYLVPRTPLERELQKEIICMCGTCGRKRLNECTCSMASAMRGEIARLLENGKTRDDVIQYFVATYGSQEPLAAPIDEGFNRLAWAVPYVVGFSGLAVAAVLAVRWSRAAGDRRPETEASRVDTVQADPALESRLADELRDLD